MDAQRSTVDAGPMSGSRGDEEGGWTAVPAVYDGLEGRPGPVLLTIEVDGEQFTVRRSGDGWAAYEWLSGPNEGYGFAASGPAPRSTTERREAIRSFLSMIHPSPGYMG